LSSGLVYVAARKTFTKVHFTHQNEYSRPNVGKPMNEPRGDEGYGSMGRWLAVASELPCSVIALLLVGQILGESLAGATGRTWGALLGALLGFGLGVYGVYVTVGYFEQLERRSSDRASYMPSMEEITEDVQFDLDDETQ
jgi:F0F1-type ATP synthase assembly protein I